VHQAVEIVHRDRIEPRRPHDPDVVHEHCRRQRRRDLGESRLGGRPVGEVDAARVGAERLVLGLLDVEDDDAEAVLQEAQGNRLPDVAGSAGHHGAGLRHAGFCSLNAPATGPTPLCRCLRRHEAGDGAEWAPPPGICAKVSRS